MSTPVLIGLNGKKGSGKNTVGEFIKDWVQEDLGTEAQLQGFADRLKLSFARIFVPDCTLEEALLFCDTIKNQGSIKHDTIFKDNGLFDRFGKRNVISGREALQNYGTEAHRQVFGDSFWVDQILPRGGGDHGEHIRWSSKWDDDITHAIITDVRFPNEAERIRELGGKVYEVVRPSLDGPEDTHASETPLPRQLVDAQIINDGTLEDLREKTIERMDAGIFVIP